jgi:hypothetical protein
MALPHKTGLAWGEFSNGVLEVVAMVATASIEEPCRPT